MKPAAWSRTSRRALIGATLGILIGCGNSGSGDMGGGTGGGNATNGGVTTTTATSSGGNGRGTGTTTGSSGADTTTSTGTATSTTNTTGTGTTVSTTSTGTVGGTSTGSSGAGCTVAPWPAADPAVDGPFATVTENNVGPAAGVGEDGGPPPMFTLFRPMDLAQGGLCHPVITWGNGTGSTPSLYGVLLRHLASHGFVVIASNSLNVGQGTPAPMVAGVTWVLDQNADPTSVMYQRIDTTHVGATGHSQGGFATTTAGADSHITTIAPICGATAQRNLHGPALLICGGMDTTVPCSTIQTAFNGITNQPVMLAEFLAATHVSWVTFRSGGAISPVEVAVTAWMRVQLMGDTALRPQFYGPTCTLCQDATWQITQKMLDQ